MAPALRLRRLLSQLLAPSACAEDAAPGAVVGLRDTPEWKAYRDAAVKRAMELGNRGPIRFGPDGEAAPEILEAYHRCGFYVFENVLAPEEVADWVAEFETCLENQPATRKGTVDKRGRPVPFHEHYNMTDFSGEVTTSTISHPLAVMDAALRLYGHPLLLRMAESVNGPDFVPHTETIFHKKAGIGAATNWHQDGRVYFLKSEEGIIAPENLTCHGFSFHGSFSDSTPEQCLWVLPGSHHRKHPDVLAGLLRRPGTFEVAATSENRKGIFGADDIDWLPDAVPMLMKPGDVGMHNRSALHGSFPNKSSGRRLTMQMGFYPRRFVVGTKVRNVHASVRPGMKPTIVTYDDEWCDLRSRMIQLATDARRLKYPHETPYVYRRHAANMEALRFNEQTRAEVINAPYYRIERDGKLISGSGTL